MQFQRILLALGICTLALMAATAIVVWSKAEPTLAGIVPPTPTPTSTPTPTPTPTPAKLPAPNDNFADATIVGGLPFTDHVDASGATIEGNDPLISCKSSYGASVWYSYTPAQNETVEVDTAGSQYDTVLAAFTGTKGNLTQVGCNDDSSGTLQSFLKLNLTGGVIYHFLVGSWLGGPGGKLKFNVNIQLPEMSLGAQGAIDCDGDGLSDTKPGNVVPKPTKCVAQFSSSDPKLKEFELTVNANVIPAGGYSDFQAEVFFGGLTYNPRDCAVELVWPDSPACPPSGIETGTVSYPRNSTCEVDCPLSSYVGPLLKLAAHCAAAGTFKVSLTAAPSSADGAAYFDLDAVLVPVSTVGTQELDVNGDGIPKTVDVADTLLINCVEQPPTFTPKEVAHALGIPNAKIQAASFAGSDTRGIAVQTGPLGNPSFPTEGTDFVILSTGIAIDAKLPDTSGSHSTELDGINNVQGNDLVQLDLELVAPADATCLRFDWAFFSEEYPEFVGSGFNDAFVAEIGGKAFAIIGNQVVSPTNIAFDPTDGTVMDVSSALAFHPPPKATDTTYDGATDLLGASTPVIPGSKVRIVFSVTDLGDSIFDTAVFLDNLRWTPETGADCPAGPVATEPFLTVSGAQALQGSKAWIRQGTTVQWICEPLDPVAQVILRFQYPWGTVDVAGKGRTTLTHIPPVNQLLGVECLVDGSSVGKIVINWMKLIDPSGQVFDTNTGLFVPGATVTLEVEISPGVFAPVPLDPSLKDPVVNPETTTADGGYAWDVAPGTYRVQVDRATCTSATSPPVTVPPPATGLDVGIKCADTDGDGIPDFFEPSTNTSPNLADTNGNGTLDGDEDPDGDGLTNLQEIALGTDPLTPDNVDSDGDGCTNLQELGGDETLGGLRNSANPHDFYDVNGDNFIDLFNDIVLVIQAFGTADPTYDRGPSAGPYPWSMTAPDGIVDLFNDIVGVIQQFGHDCR